MVGGWFASVNETGVGAMEGESRTRTVKSQGMRGGFPTVYARDRHGFLEETREIPWDFRRIPQRFRQRSPRIPARVIPDSRGRGAGKRDACQSYPRPAWRRLACSRPFSVRNLLDWSSFSMKPPRISHSPSTTCSMVRRGNPMRDAIMPSRDAPCS